MIIFPLIRLAAYAIVLLAACASAHDIVMFPQWENGMANVEIRYGHPQDYQQISPEKLYEFSARDPNKTTQDLFKALKPKGIGLALDGYPAPNADAGITLFSAQYDNGYWSKTPDGRTVNTSKLTFPNSPAGTHNLKYGKALVSTGPSHRGFDARVGHKLELVPLADPLSVKPGQTLPVAVYFKGKLLPNAGVEIGDGDTAMAEDKIPRYKTDSKGVAQVPISKSGWEVIGVDYEEKSTLPRLSSMEKYTATLTFRINP